MLATGKSSSRRTSSRRISDDSYFSCMNSVEFAYWLQGYFELRDNDEPLTAKQVQIIKDHLALVFNKVTPDREAKTEKEEYPDVRPNLRDVRFDRPDLICAPAAVEPPIQSTVVPTETDIKERFKKLEAERREQEKHFSVTCTTASPEKMTSVWSGRAARAFDRGSTSFC